MWRQKKFEAKYGNVRQLFDGRTYHSKKEAAYAGELTLRKKAGEITDFTPQFRLPLVVGGQHIADYLVDFLVEYPDGVRELVEVKGFETDVWRIKWKLTIALYSDTYEITLVK